MPSPMSLDRSLALATEHTPLVIRRIPFESLRAFCAARGLREGDQVQRRSPTAAAPVVVETPSGARVLVPLEYATLIECEPARVERRP